MQEIDYMNDESLTSFFQEDMQEVVLSEPRGQNHTAEAGIIGQKGREDGTVT